MPKRSRFVATINISFLLLAVTATWSLAQAPQEQPPAPLDPPPAERSVVQPVYNLKPDESYTKLANPDIASRMGLSDEQIAKVQSLMVERSQKLKDAPQDQWDAIRAENEDKLKAVLTEEQQANWLKVIHEKRIVFIGKDMPWADVLDWFSKQLGLQLIMTTPPTGTFSYADRTEYSPAEALDKLNSVLQARGYTLVRTDNLLILFHLRQSSQAQQTPLIPPVYLQKLRPEDLENCKANFEFVIVTYSLGRRDRAAVDTQLKPFLGHYSHVVNLPGNSFMLTDIVATQRIVKKLIEAIPEPKPREERPDPGTPPPPPTSWQTYVIEKTDPEKVEEIIKQFCGISQMVRLPNSPQLHILGNDDQHRSVRQIIDRIEVDPGTTFAPTVEVYSLDQLAEASPQQLWALYSVYGFQANLFDVNKSFVEEFLNIIKEVVPNAISTYEKNNRKLVVLATPDDQEKVAALVEKLKRSALAEDAPVTKVYTLKNGSPSFIKKVVDNVKQLIPKAIVDFNTADRCLLVVGTADEHKMITDTIEELETLSADNIERKMVCYPVNQALLLRFNTLWRQLRQQPEFEGVLELSEGRDNQLTIWGTSDQHVRMRQVLRELMGDGEAMSGESSQGGDGTTSSDTSIGGGSNKLISRSFVIRRGNLGSLQYILQQVIPGISVMPEYGSNSIFVFGTEESLKAVEDFVNKVDNEYGINVIVLPVNERISNETLGAMQAMFRNYGSVRFDEKNLRLIAYGRKADLEQITQFVETFNKAAGDEPKSIFVQPVERTMPDHLVEFVRDAVPRADIQYDGENKRLTIAGTKADQLLASKLILEAEASLPPREQIRFYPVGRVVSDKMINLIKNEVQHIVEIKRDDQDPMTLFVKARPAVLDEVERMLEEIDTQLPTTRHNTLKSYPVTPTERSRFDKLQDDLKKEIGDFRIMDDDRKNLMVIWALPQQHERIAALFETVKAEAPAELQEQIIMHSLRFTDAKTLQDLVKEVYPDVNIREDAANGRLIVRVPKQNAEAVKLLLDQIDSQDPNRVNRYFASYPIGSVNTYGPNGEYYGYYHMLQQLQALVPNAKLTYDNINATIIVWGTDEEQKIIKETIENVHNTEPADRFGRFPLRRAEPYGLMTIIHRMFRSSNVEYERANKTLVVQTVNGEQLRMIRELIEKLDPAEPGPNDLQVRFYQLKQAAPAYLISTLQQMVPSAQFIPDDVNRQLMVLARPSEHDLIRENVDLIVSTFTPDEPVLFVYSVTDDQRKRIEAFVTTAAAELRGLRIVDDTRPGQMSIWARPLEHQLINDVLVMMSANTDADFELEFKAFSLTAVDAETVKEALATRVPEAKLIFDEKGMRMLVWAAKSDMINVTKTFETLDPTSTKNLKYMTYPIALGDPETVLESIKQVYPNIKSQVDERNQRLLIWATPEEHAAIAEMIEKTNADTGITLQERYQSYPIPKLSYVSVQAMLTALFPGTEIYADYLSPNVTVRATTREHEQIKTLLEQMQSTDDQYHAEFAIYSMGNADPVTLEAMLQGMFPNAESLTGYEIKNLLQEDPNRTMRMMGGYWDPYDMPMNRRQRQMEARAGTREGCFKVDQATRSIFVFLPAEDQKKIASAIESLVEASELSGGKIVKSYPLMGYFWAVYPILEESFPGVKFTRGADYTSVIVVATEFEHERFAQFIKEYNQISNEPPYIFSKLFVIPDGTNVSRTTIIRQINRSVDMSYAMNGAQPNQILVMTNRQEESLIQELIDELAKERLPEETVTPEVYVLKYITVSDATNYLKVIAPNALFGTEEPEDDDDYYWPPRPRRTPTPNATGTQRLVVRATPKDHLAIKAAIEILDIDLPGEIKPVPREYSFANYHPRVLYQGYRSLIQAFPAPKATFTLNDEAVAVVAVAAPQTHKEIEDFIKNYFDQKETEQPKLEVYAFDKSLVGRVYTVINQAVPRANLFPGVTPDQLVVFARPIDQQKVAEILAKLETITISEDTMQLKAYHVPPASLPLLTQSLQSQVIGGIAWPNYLDSTILVYGSEREHEIAAAQTKSVGESFPEPVTKTYFPKNIPIGQAIGFLQPQFTGRAWFYIRTDTYDLIAHATPKVHEEIQKTIDAIDVPRPVESEKIAVVYDLSEIPASWFYNWTLPTITAVSPAHVGTTILPTHVPGQIAVYATPVEQVKIQKVVDEMLAKYPNSDAVPENYSLKTMTAQAAWHYFLIQVAPNVLPGFSSTDPHKITIWAKPSVHEKIKEAVDKLNEDVSASTEARMYRFQRITWNTAYYLLLTKFPGMSMSHDVPSNSLLVHATPEEHEKIAAIVAEMDKSDPETQEIAENYTFKSMTASVAWYQFLAQVAPLARVGFNSTDPHKLTIWDKPASHERIKQAVDKLNENVATGTVARMYRFQRVTWSTVYHVLLSQYPGMYMSYDTPSNSLVVHATPEEHKKIAAMVAEMDKYDPETQVSIQIHNTGAAGAAQLAQALRLFYTTDPAFRAVQDTLGRNLIVTAKPEQHKLIDSLIDQISNGGMQDPDATLVVYDMDKLDTYTVRSALNQFFYRQGIEFNPAYDYMSGRLMVLARPREHAAIRLIMDSFRAEERELVIFALRELDPESVRMMVSQLFYEEPISKRPSLEVDYYSDMLYIRATSSQHEKIREMLARFGETGVLQPTHSPVNYQPGHQGGMQPGIGHYPGAVQPPVQPVLSGSSNFRTIQFDGNADELIEKLQKNWPQINPDNPLVVTGKDDEKTNENDDKGNDATPQQPEQPGTTLPAVQPEATPPGSQPTMSPGYYAPRGMTGENGPKVFEIELDPRLADAVVLEPFDAIAFVSYAEPVTPMQDVPTLNPVQPEMQQPEAQTQSQPETPQTPSEQEAAPTEQTQQTPQNAVYLIVGEDGTISFYSNDPAALDRLAAALTDSTSTGTNTGSGNAVPTAPFNRVKYEDREYTEYEIRHLAPTVLVQRLQMRLPARFPNRATAGQGAYNRRGGYGNFGGGFGGYSDYSGYASTSRPPMPTLVPQDMLNTVIVRGTRRDRAVIAEMIEELDVPDPIYLPVPVYVKNTDPLKVYQELLVAYGTYISNIRLPNGLKPNLTVDKLNSAIIIQGPDDMVATLTKYIEETDSRLAEQPPKRIHVEPLPINATLFNKVIQELYPKDYQQYYYGLPYAVPMYQQNYGYGGYNYNMPGNYNRRAY